MPLVDGITFMHEHTTIDLSGLKGTDDCNLNCFDETINEYKELYQQGVRNIVDVTNIGMGRNVEYVEAVALASGINIIHATGFYQHKFLPPVVFEAPVEELAQIMINDIEIGIDGTDYKAEIIGEIGTSKNEMSPQERKVFEAAMIAANKTGKNLTTHTTLGTYGHEQVAFFKEHNFDLDRVVIGHVDLTGDIDYILHMLQQGVYVEFDTVGKENYMADSRRLEMLKIIEAQGFSDKVFLSLDITRKSHLKYLDGLGYTFLLDNFVPMIREGGVSESFIDKMLITNPQKFMNR